MVFKNVTSKKHKKQKLSYFEKLILLSFTGLAKIIIKKVKRAKNYGDLNKILVLLQERAKTLENVYSENEIFNDDLLAQSFIKDIEQTKLELKKI